MTQKKIHIYYYALFRELRGKNEEWLETKARSSLELFEEVRQRIKLSLPRNMVKVVINDEFSTWDVELKDGDRLAFIPPVAGG